MKKLLVIAGMPFFLGFGGFFSFQSGVFGGTPAQDKRNCENQNFELDTRIAACTRALKAFPKNGLLWFERAYAWNQKEHFDNAIADYSLAISLKLPQDILELSYHNRGLALAYKQEYDRALADFTKVLFFSPRNHVAYMHRGHIWYEKQEYDRAIADYTQSIAISPKTDVYLHRARSWHQKFEFNRALEDYNRLISIMPQYYSAYIDRGRVWHDKKVYSKAIEDYTKALSHSPRYAYIYCLRGISWADKKDFARATLDYTSAISLNPEYSEAYINRALSFAFLHKYSEAEQDLKIALKQAPQNKTYVESLGWIYYLQGQTAQAREAFEQLWPLLEPPSKWTGWLEVYLPELLRDVPHTSADLAEINVLLKKAQMNEDKVALIQIYEKLLHLQKMAPPP